MAMNGILPVKLGLTKIGLVSSLFAKLISIANEPFLVRWVPLGPKQSFISQLSIRDAQLSQTKQKRATSSLSLTVVFFLLRERNKSC